MDNDIDKYLSNARLWRHACTIVRPFPTVSILSSGERKQIERPSFSLPDWNEMIIGLSGSKFAKTTVLAGSPSSWKTQHTVLASQGNHSSWTKRKYLSEKENRGHYCWDENSCSTVNYICLMTTLAPSRCLGAQQYFFFISWHLILTTSLGWQRRSHGDNCGCSSYILWWRWSLQGFAMHGRE